jgi:hypothetical protein
MEDNSKSNSENNNSYECNLTENFLNNGTNDGIIHELFAAWDYIVKTDKSDYGR